MVKTTLHDFNYLHFLADKMVTKRGGGHFVKLTEVQIHLSAVLSIHNQ